MSLIVCGFVEDLLGSQRVQFGRLQTRKSVVIYLLRHDCPTKNVEPLRSHFQVESYGYTLPPPSPPAHPTYSMQLSVLNGAHTQGTTKIPRPHGEQWGGAERTVDSLPSMMRYRHRPSESGSARRAEASSALLRVAEALAAPVRKPRFCLRI